MRIQRQAVSAALLLFWGMQCGLAAPVAPGAREGVVLDQFLNIVALAPVDDDFLALVAPSSNISRTEARPIQIARIGFRSASELTVDVQPIRNFVDDGELWRKRPILAINEPLAYFAHLSNEGRTQITRVSLNTNSAETLSTQWEGEPVALFVSGEDLVLITTLGMFVANRADQSLVRGSGCRPIHGAKLDDDTYVVLCGTSVGEIEVQEVVVAQPGTERTSPKVLGSIHGSFLSAGSGSIASGMAVLVADPETKELELSTLTRSGEIKTISLQGTEFNAAVNRVSRISVTTTAGRPLIALSKSDQVSIFRRPGDRTAAKTNWSFKDADGRVAHVRMVSPLSMNERTYLIVETHLWALQGLALKRGARNASRISLVPID